MKDYFSRKNEIKIDKVRQDGDKFVENSWNYYTIIQIAEEVVQVRNTYGKKKKQTAWWREEVKNAIVEKMR